jgi:hypothetical protein
MLRWGKSFTKMAGLAALLGLGLTGSASAGRPAGKPAYLWLWYADGTSPQPEDGPYCTGLRPPPFECSYGTDIADCQRQVQAYLDAWYAGFNLVFTFSRPPTGDYYVIVITSQGTWCDQNSSEAGVAFFNCNDNPGQAGFAFECGKNAHACATIIAHEHGHMVGLEHTSIAGDVMNEYVQATATGFADQSGRTVDQLCEGTQNSYQQMLTALGAWPGGAKPSPFAPATLDAAVADAKPDLQSADASDAGTGESDAPSAAAGIDTGPITTVGGFDALPRPPLPTVDAASLPPKSLGGCALADRPTPDGSSPVVLLGLLALAVIRSRGRFRPVRRVPPADEPPPCATPAPSPSAVRARER